MCTLIFNPKLNSDGPRWLHLLTGLCILTYQTLDNMDGIQARRINASSPLGMLFDHTCDTINAGLMSIAIASCIATGWTVRIYFCLLSGYFPFYFQAWEEYYTGTLVLPPFNGPTEGLLIAAAMCIISSYKGAYWCHQVVFEITVPESIGAYLPHAWSSIDEFDGSTSVSVTPFAMFYASALIAAAITASKQIITVLVHVRKSGRSSMQALLDLLPFVTFFPGLLIYGACSKVALAAHPLTMMLYFSSTMVEMLVHIMAAHVCDSVIKPLERYAVWPCLLLLYLASNDHLGDDHWVEVRLLQALAIYSTLRTTIKLYQLCTEAADELGLYVFVVGKRPTIKST